MTGRVFDIQRFSLHDGPGIRTTVFLQGCSNRCAWCHNPESLDSTTGLKYYPHHCIGCGACIKACSHNAHDWQNETHILHRDRCTVCGACAAVCHTGALLLSGKEMSVDDVLAQVCEDIPYYQKNGGLTLSGGEPALQHEFATALLSGAKKKGIHTVMETAGNYSAAWVAEFTPFLDMVLFDVKAWSDILYHRYIHGDRKRIMAVLDEWDKAGLPIALRTPVIGGVNDHEEEIEAIARHAATLDNLCYYQLIPYHGLGRAKYEALALPYEQFATPTPQRMEELEKAAAQWAPVYNHKNGFIGSKG